MGCYKTREKDNIRIIVSVGNGHSVEEDKQDEMKISRNEPGDWAKD